MSASCAERLWGERVVYAFITALKRDGTVAGYSSVQKKPDVITLDYSLRADERIQKYGEGSINCLYLACYLLRWNVKVSYYKGKVVLQLEENRIIGAEKG